MRKIITVLIAAAMLTGCGAVDNEKKDDSSSTSDESHIEYPEDTIVFLERYQNWAEGYQDNGQFIDINGNIYEFDLAQETDDPWAEPISNENLIERMRQIMSDEEPIGQADPDEVYKCRLLAKDIDPEREYEQESYACDAGQDTLYILNDDNEIIKLYSWGDYIEECNDRTAKKIVKKYNKLTE